MDSRVAEVEKALLALAPDERAAVIHRGLVSLDPDDADASRAELDAAWTAELDKRRDEVLTGHAPLGSFESTHETFTSRFPAPTS